MIWTGRMKAMVLGETRDGDVTEKERQQKRE